MIPLVHSQWTEVRTLAVGEVQPPRTTPDGPVVVTTNRSSFSRRVDSTTFGDLATGERHRRGIAGTRRVGAVVDGAGWCQTFVDLAVPLATSTPQSRAQVRGRASGVRCTHCWAGGLQEHIAVLSRL